MVDTATNITISVAVRDCFAVEAITTVDLQSGADFSIADIDEIFARSFP